MQRPSRRLPFYLIPFVIGMCGVLFAAQLPGPFRLTVILVSVAGPLFVGGFLLARLYARGVQRFLLIAATVLLMLGALVTISDVSGSLAALEEVPQGAVSASRWIGVFSLLVGLATILFSVARTGEAIDEIGERFRHLANHMSEGFVLSAPDGMIVLVNHRFEEMMGLTEQEVVGHYARDVVSRLNLDAMMPHLEKRDRGVASEYRITWSVGGEDRVYLVSGTPISDRQGAHAGTLATIRDITEQDDLSQRLEEYAASLAEQVAEKTQKLQQSEGRLRDLLVHMNEGFLAIDRGFRVRFANERICKMLDVSRNELSGQELFDLIEPTGRGRLLDMFETVDKDASIKAQQEFTLNTANGGQVPVMIAAALIADPAEEDLRYSVVITDVTRLKAMQRQVEVRAAELEAANEELRLIDRAKDGFLSNVSHELRTPLSTIRGYVEMLHSQTLGVLSDQQKSALSVMSRNMQRLTVLIDEMIEFSRMEIKGVQLARTLLGVDGLVHEAVSAVEPQLLAKEMKVDAYAPMVFPLIWGDRKKLLQVMGILLINAIKFSPTGSRIVVTVGMRDTNTVTIAVKDAGIGIDPAFHKRVFAKFFQVDSSLTRRYEGAGIGLSIAKNIVESHGGSVELESEIGKGSTFTVALPNSRFDAELPQLYRKSLDGVGIILAIDDKEFCKGVSAVLKAAGSVTTIVSKGYECIRLAKDKPPSLVILDEALPDLTGPAVCAKLQADPATNAIPVLVLSGGLVTASFAVERWQGAVRYQEKPFSGSELVSKAGLLVAQAITGQEAAPEESADTPAKSGRCVLMVDTDTDVLEWVETALGRRQIHCVCVSDPEHGVRAMQRVSPDVIFVDVDAVSGGNAAALAVFHGADAARGIPVYAITALPAERLGINGWTGIMRKPFSIRELMDIVVRSPHQGSGRT